MYKRFFILMFLFSIILSSSSYSQILFTASLDGSQEVPPVTTTAMGTAWFVLSEDMTSLTYHITYARLQSGFTASHLHVGFSGVNGGVVHPITFTGNTASGTWTNIPDSIVGKLFKEGIYVNIHTTGNPGGEIRGQLLATEGIGFTAMLDGSQEVPPVTTNATGTAWAILENSGTQIRYAMTVAGLSSAVTASHFHNAAAGVNGGVVQGITITDSTVTGTWSGFANNIITEILKNRLYMNVHTSNHPGGEIRGQLMHMGEVLFTANLEGGQEVPPVTTNGTGTAWFVLKDDLNSIEYNVTYARLTGNFTASHIHLAPVGVNGGVIYPISYIGNSASGIITNIPDSTIVNFIKANTYINVHSSSFPGGEIRGQIDVNRGIGFVARLDGGQSVPPVTTTATGTGWFSYEEDVSRVTGLFYRITIAGLSSALTAAHFHTAPAGVNGGVAEPITFTDSTVHSSWMTIGDVLLSQIAKAGVYANVHTANNPGGEIRGQLWFTNVISVPVELTSFSASAIDNNVELNWTTATETNNSGFYVERSSDNKQFASLGFVQGSGTTAELRTYNYTDAGLSSGMYYYRLRQVDFDGSNSYSKTLSVEIGAPGRFDLSQNYPNPFNPATTINFKIPERTQVSLKVYNVLGKEVAVILNDVKEAGSYTYNFNADELASGVYVYKLQTGNGLVETRKMTLIK